MTLETIFTPYEMGPNKLPHRLAMAPMTRSRAFTDGRVDPLSATYYSQRAAMGLLISEGTQPSLEGQGYLNSPGIYTEAHIEAWREVTQAVHRKGGKFFIQLMHAGRMNHPDNTPDHHQGVAPSSVAPENGHIFTAQGMQAVPLPRALTTTEIAETVADFRHAARSAIEAGADGVEIHGANGYLIHEFFGTNSNVRTDEYGGSLANRIRFALEVTAAIVEEIGAERVGFRISPYASFSTIDEGTQGEDLYRLLVAELATFNLAYLHILHTGHEGLLWDLREIWPNTLIVNRYGREMADLGEDLEKNLADLVSVGTWALANPDFPERLKTGGPFNEPNHATFFGGAAEGYVDYPTING